MRNGSRTTNRDTVDTVDTTATIDAAYSTSVCGTSRTTNAYLLSTDAHVTLRFLRDELHLLARLAEPRNDDDRDEIVVSTEALSDCFSRIAEQIDEALRTVQPCG